MSKTSGTTTLNTSIFGGLGGNGNNNPHLSRSPLIKDTSQGAHDISIDKLNQSSKSNNLNMNNVSSGLQSSVSPLR